MILYVVRFDTVEIASFELCASCLLPMSGNQRFALVSAGIAVTFVDLSVETGRLLHHAE